MICPCVKINGDMNSIYSMPKIQLFDKLAVILQVVIKKKKSVQNYEQWAVFIKLYWSYFQQAMLLEQVQYIILYIMFVQGLQTYTVYV